MTPRRQEHHSNDAHSASAAALRNILLSVPSGSLTLVMGCVGAGKSSLIHGLLGEMRLLRGTVHSPVNVAYTSQQVRIYTVYQV